MLIFLACTYLEIRTHFWGGGTYRAEFGTLEFRGQTIRTVVNRADWQLGNRVTGVGYGDGGGGILHIVELSICAESMTWYIQVKSQIIVIPGVVRLLYQHYAHIPLKHNFIYNSVHIKHDGWQFQGLLHLLTVTVCWWPAVYKAVSPCDIIFIQLLLEHPVQVIHTTVHGKNQRIQM